MRNQRILPQTTGVQAPATAEETRADDGRCQAGVCQTFVSSTHGFVEVPVSASRYRDSRHSRNVQDRQSSGLDCCAMSIVDRTDIRRPEAKGDPGLESAASTAGMASGPRDSK